ncbi:hypothetical protein STEG23_015721, partial [Scotinomys teguina]
ISFMFRARFLFFDISQCLWLKYPFLLPYYPYLRFSLLSETSRIAVHFHVEHSSSGPPWVVERNGVGVGGEMRDVERVRDTISELIGRVPSDQAVWRRGSCKLAATRLRRLKVLIIEIFHLLRKEKFPLSDFGIEKDLDGK